MKCLKKKVYSLQGDISVVDVCEGSVRLVLLNVIETQQGVVIGGALYAVYNRLKADIEGRLLQPLAFLLFSLVERAPPDRTITLRVLGDRRDSSAG